MVEAERFVVRPHNPARADLKDSFKIHLSAATLSKYGPSAGDLCRVSTSTGLTFPAIAWLAKGKIQDNIVQTSRTMQSLYGLKLTDHIYLSRNSETMLDAIDVILFEDQDPDRQSQVANVEGSEEIYWAWLLGHELRQAETLCPGMLFTQVRAMGQERAFRIATINGSDELGLYRSSTILNVAIASKDDHHVEPCKVDPSAVGGLDAQILELNNLITPYSPSAVGQPLICGHQERRGGIIIHGASGTGKSMLLRMVSAAGWRKVFHIQSDSLGTQFGEWAAAVHHIFEDAHRHQPSLVIIDDLDVVAGKDELSQVSRSSNLASSLCQAYDNRGDSRVLILAATRDLALIHETLRRPGRFESEIELPVPGQDARAEILSLVVRLPKASPDPRLVQLASRTHGYVGSDLKQLIQVAMDKAALRIRASGDNQELNGDIRFEEAVMDSDIEIALKKVKPTAMKEIFLDIPQVRWSDIGGQAEVKKALQEAVEWPFVVRYRSKHRKSMILRVEASFQDDSERSPSPEGTTALRPSRVLKDARGQSGGHRSQP